MAVPEPQGCLETIMRSFFGMVMVVLAIALVVAVFVHG